MGRLVRLLLAAGVLVSPVPAIAAEWTSLKTDHFLLIGDAKPGDIKDVALRFEQFRAAVTTAFPVLADDRPGPPVVILVFRDQKSYEPYTPRFNGKAVSVGGYYLGGHDVNYITLTADTRSTDYQTVYHEYTHLLLRRVAADASPWMNEGLAEYFSSFDASGNTARFGRPLLQHIDLLRDRQMALLELFAVTHDSQTYNEGSKRGLFYAESWLLVHDAFIDRPDLWKKLIQFETLVHSGQNAATAFERALGAAPSALEQELQDLVRQTTMQYQVVTLDQRITTRIQGQPAPLTGAEADAWLGDLLAHAGRTDEAAALLARSLKASPELPLAHAAMGTLLLRQNKNDDAMSHLEKAAASASANEFVHFYYGAALVQHASRSTENDELSKAIASLERAVQARAGFTDAEKMLGYGYLLANQADKGREMLQRALDDNPADSEVALMLAEAELHLGQLADARRLLGPILGRTVDARIKEHARDLLGYSARLELQQQHQDDAPAERSSSAAEPPIASPAPQAARAMPVLRETQPGETRSYGRFVEIDCQPNRIVLHVKTAGDALVLRAARFDAIDFITYRTNTAGSISCGARRPPEDVYVTWRRDAAAGSQGVVVAVELLPDGFVPAP